MKRANCSAKTPNASESYDGRADQRAPLSPWGCRGGRAARGLSHGSPPARSSARCAQRLVAPVLRQQVVEQVVDGDRAEQAAVLVDDRRRDQVVRREVGARPRRCVASGRSGSIVGVEGARRPASRAARAAAAGCARRRAAARSAVSSGWPADVDQRRQRRPASSALRTWASASAIGGVGAEDHRLGGHHAAGGLLGVGHQPPDVLGLVGLHQLEQRARRSRAAGRRSGRRRRRATSPRARRRRARCRGAPRISTWSSSGSSSSTSASRSSSSAATTAVRRSGGRSWITLAASAGAHLVERRDQVGGALRRLAARPARRRRATPRRGSGRGGAGPWPAPGRATRLSTQSRVRACSIATS